MRVPNRISSAILVRDSRTISANGALGRHEKESFVEVWHRRANWQCSGETRQITPVANNGRFHAAENFVSVKCNLH
jgi:hypothetical protein